jgi:molybdopterin-binding protein
LTGEASGRILTMATTGRLRQGDSLKTSARNQFAGIVKEITRGPVSSEVTLEVAPGINLVGVISTRSAEGLGLAVGKRAYGLIKASNVVVAID